jgi:adenine-specific DNA-methyltransferase
VTERLDKDGNPEAVVDFDKLRQELSTELVEGAAERYQFTWPDKRAANHLANQPTTMTLRPCEEESVGKDGTNGVFDSENLYIEGDNLDVLKVLRETYLGKVKMIYIDPPYNTGNDFVYNDDFAESYEEFAESCKVRDEEGNLTFDPKANGESNGRFHTDWLNMIYPRLKVARDLLSEDGSIFITLDEHESYNAKKILDEIFGESNFISTIIWENFYGRSNAAAISPAHNYILIYSKAGENWKYIRHLLPRDEKSTEKYKNPDNDPRGPWRLGPIFASGERHEGLMYTIKTPSGKLVSPPKGSHWRMLESDFWKLYEDGRILFGMDGSGAPATKLYLNDVQDGMVPRSIWSYQEVGHTQDGKREIQELFPNEMPFDTPKPTKLIRQIIQIACNKDDIIMDFFSGSATTAHAVLQHNATDGGTRKFIMVQIPEITSAESPARKAGYNTICEIGKERIRRAGRKIKEEAGLQGQDLDIGFRVLKLAESNMENVYYSPDKFDANNLFTLEDNVKADRTAEDLLFQVMLELGVELSSPIEKKSINGVEVFNVKDGFLIATFDKNVNESTITEIAKSEPVYFVMRDASAANDNVLDNFDQLFRHYSPDTIRRIL